MSPQGSPGESKDDVEGDSKEEERNEMADGQSAPVPTEGKAAEEDVEEETSAEDAPKQGPEVKGDDEPGRTSSCTSQRCVWKALHNVTPIQCVVRADSREVKARVSMVRRSD